MHTLLHWPHNWCWNWARAFGNTFLYFLDACHTWCNIIPARFEPFSCCLLECPAAYMGAFRVNLWPCTRPPPLIGFPNQNVNQKGLSSGIRWYIWISVLMHQNISGASPQNVKIPTSSPLTLSEPIHVYINRSWHQDSEYSFYSNCSTQRQKAVIHDASCSKDSNSPVPRCFNGAIKTGGIVFQRNFHSIKKLDASPAYCKELSTLSELCDVTMYPVVADATHRPLRLPSSYLMKLSFFY